MSSARRALARRQGPPAACDAAGLRTIMKPPAAPVAAGAWRPADLNEKARRMTKRILRGAKVLTMDGQTLDPGYVAIENGR